jgi:mono/diheme cytochrome c family protein
LNRLLIIVFIGLIGVLYSITYKSSTDIRVISKRINVSELGLEDILSRLGDKPLNHRLVTFDDSKAQIGLELIKYGKTSKQKSKRISKHFVCTDCHNLGREFEELSDDSAENRLEYARKNGLNYLPGSTFYGIYNRTSFYNDDYIKKYGNLVDNARDTLENSIQLCAKYCSSGRYLESWEVEAIMHYFKKTELKLRDINLTENQLKNVLNSQKMNSEEKSELVSMIKSKYSQSYSAHFKPTMDRNDRKYGEGGDVENGKAIYNSSCLFCHYDKRVTYLNLDETQITAQMFWRNIESYTDKSLYQIIRYGTYAKTGRKQYMPLYTDEKMSDSQINDLVAYIKQLAGK